MDRALIADAESHSLRSLFSMTSNLEQTTLVRHPELGSGSVEVQPYCQTDY